MSSCDEIRTREPTPGPNKAACSVTDFDPVEIINVVVLVADIGIAGLNGAATTITSAGDSRTVDILRIVIG
jgi:hypothetical protein